jgi:hypothetical protein
MLIRSCDTGLALSPVPEFSPDGMWPPTETGWPPVRWELSEAQAPATDFGSIVAHALVLAPDEPPLPALPLSFRSCVPFGEIRLCDVDGVGDFFGVPGSSFGGGPAGCPMASWPVAGQGEDGGVQAGQRGTGAGGAVSAVPAGASAATWERTRPRTAVNGMSPGSSPVDPVARAVAVATMLWISRSAQASWRASSGDWPRSGLREPRTVRFR